MLNPDQKKIYSQLLNEILSFLEDSLFYDATYLDIEPQIKKIFVKYSKALENNQEDEMNLNKEQEETVHDIIINYEVKQEGNLAVLCLTPSGVRIYINPDGSINHTDEG